MSLPLSLAAGEDLAAGRIVFNDSGTIKYADSPASGPPFINCTACLSGDYPQLAEIGTNVLVETNGSVTANSVLGATTDGVVTSVTITGAAAAWSVGYSPIADTGTNLRMAYDPQKHSPAA